jgi:hypothetical protein
MSKTDLETYTDLCAKIKATRAELKEMNKIKAQVEKRITEFLKAREIPGVNFHGIKIIIEKRMRKPRTKKSEERARIAKVLQAHGVANTDSIIDQLFTFKKTSTEVLKIK